tara:strand:- start:2816 stop:3322 length:507 start_codon:yes stop_codon:yes gene_type:complete
MVNNSNFLITIFVIIGVATRIIPHPPNLTALGAVALFGGALYFDKKISLIIPIIILAISDFILGFQMNISVYFSFLLIVFLGFNLRNKLSFKNIISYSISSGLIFYAVTNFFVFLGSTYYSQDIYGLVLCYTLALPFLANTILGNLLYSLALFYSFKYVHKKINVSSQ